MDLVSYAVPLFILAIILEFAWGLLRGRNTYRINDAVSSLFLGTLSQARKLVTLGVGGIVYHLVAEHYALVRMSSDSVLTWVLAMVLYDFCYYWLHRLGHERTIFWAAHVVHHQSEDYNLSTALRQTSTGFLLGWVFYLPMFLLGIPAEIVVTVGSLNLIYQFWVHTEHVGKLGWWEWFFVTPSNHRVHHAQNERYLDRNYGGLFIIWDRLFGTFQEELADDPPVYGIRGALRSWNPLHALTHIYVGMLRDSWRAKAWKDKLRVWVSRTGWRPADLAVSSPASPADLSQFSRFDPRVGRTVNAYALFQLLAMVALLGYLQFGLTQDYLLQITLVLVMLGSMVLTAMWLGGVAGPALMVLDSLRLLALGLGWMAAGDSLRFAGFAPAALCYLTLNAAFLVMLARQNPRGARQGLPAL